jgi:hypothetical protein
MATTAGMRWSEIIDQQETSGQTLRAFAEANGLNRNTLAWWRWELGRTRPRQRPRPNPSSSPRFVELAVAESNPELASLEIGLHGLAASLVVDQQTDLALLRRVLEALC